MVQFCCAYGCSSSSDVDKNLIFHKFPDAVKDKERHLQWINRMKRKNFKPSASSKLCSLHFQPADYDPPIYSGPPRLKKNAVPSIFNFPDHLTPKIVPERRHVVYHIPETQQIPQDIQETTVTINETSHSTVAVQTTLTGIELTETLEELRRSKHCLQKQVQRRNVRVSKLGDLIKLLKQNLVAETDLSTLRVQE